MILNQVKSVVLSRVLVLSIALGGLACTPKRSAQVSEAPRWMTEKDNVRIEIVRTLLEGGDSYRSLELIKVLRLEGVDKPELDLLQGTALRMQGMVEDAERLYKRAAENMPKNSEVQRALCVLYADTGEHSKALDACQMATELDPKDAAAWNNYGFLLLTSNQPAEAKDALQHAVDIDATSGRYRNNLAFAQAANGNHRTALRTFLTTGTPADAHYNVGTAFEREGDTKMAIVYYEKALKYDPNHIHADEALQRLLSTTPKEQ